jgi:transcription elongation factor Elf1
MEYVTKTCPICTHEFVVLEKVEKKAIYCTLACLSVAQGKINREKVSSAISA